MARRQTPDVMDELLGAKEPSPEAVASAGAPPDGPAIRPAGADPATAAAKEVIHDHAVWASGIGLLPIPVLDVVALTALQVRMLSVLARTYDRDFSRSAASATLAALLSSNAADILHRGAVGSILRAVPVVGWVCGALVMPAAAAALTYAVGALFAQHFATGGTLFDLDVKAWKGSFKQQYRQGLALFGRRTASGSQAP